MTKLSEISPSKNQRVLLIGYPGVGKTIAAMSYPGEILNFDLDDRIKPVLNYFPQNLERDDVEKYDAYSFERFFNRIQKLRQGDIRHKTYVLDSLTSLARMTINFSQENRGLDKGKLVKNIPIMDLADFNAEGSLLSHVLNLFRSLNANFIMTAHHVETTSKKKKNASDMVGEDISVHRIITAGKTIAAELPAYFDEIYYIHKIEKVQPPHSYRASTLNMNGIECCKTALGLPAEIDFTMTKGGDGLYQKIVKDCKSRGIEL